MEKTFKVTGMKCQGCKNNIEKEVKKIKGVKTAEVNLEENTLLVKGDFNQDEIIEKVKSLEYEIK